STSASRHLCSGKAHAKLAAGKTGMGSRMLAGMMHFADAALGAGTPEEASQRFFAGAERIGATYLQTRLYRRPAARLTSEVHWAAGGFVKRISPERWPGSVAFNYICFEMNPLLTAIRENRTRYRFSD